MYRPEDIGDSSNVRCGFRDCHACCMGTEMIVTKNEADEIVKHTGLKRDDFLAPLEEVDGFLQLINVESEIGTKCFFLSLKGKCTIYEVAPMGCKMYPLILNLESDETMIDVDCRERTWFRKQTYYQSQVITVKQLVSTLIFENEERVDELNLFPDKKADIDTLYFQSQEEEDELREFIRQMDERGE